MQVDLILAPISPLDSHLSYNLAPYKLGNHFPKILQLFLSPLFL